jgi:hypothetical protein
VRATPIRHPIIATVAVLASALVAAAVLPAVATAGPTGRAALAAVNALPPTPNTAWGLDPATGGLRLTVSDAAPAAGAARLLAVAHRFGVHVLRTRQPLTEQDLLSPADGVLVGGDSINDAKIICSVGFNVLQGGVRYLLTAGHCTQGLPTWTGVGPSVVSAFPGTDYGVIRNDQATAPGAVDRWDGTWQSITSTANATVGEAVCASGQTTHVTCGHVTAVDLTVDYGDGNVVRGLIETDVHTDHGDSGGSLFDGPIGLGMVSGGDGTTDYFQPLPPVLAAYDLVLSP